MTKEEKELLLKDLCARLPYGVIVKENDGVKENDNELLDIDMFDRCINYDYTIYDIKPYLRPMSSMTEEERKEYESFIFTHHHEWDGYGTNTRYVEAVEAKRYIDWLNAHHFDFRGLIDKGLALEAPEGMYKTE